MPATVCSHVDVPLGTGEVFRLPYWHVTSGRPGPVLLLTAAQHAMELQGCEALQRFHELCLTELRRGEVYFIPFANLPAIRTRRPNLTALPERPFSESIQHNLGYLWPGDPTGNDTARLAWAISQAIVPHCTHSLDLHSWSRFTAPCSMARQEVAESWRMAEVLPQRFRRPLPEPASDNPCMLEHLFAQRGLGGAIIELPPQWTVTGAAVSLGLQSVVNVARALELLDGEPELPEGPIIEFTPQRLAAEGRRVTAPCSGLFVEESGLAAGEHVTVGQRLGHLIADRSLETVEIFAPAAGYLWLYGCHRAHADVTLTAMHPYAEEGDVLAEVLG